MKNIANIFQKKWWSPHKLFLALSIVGTLFFIIGRLTFNYDVDRRRGDFIEKHKSLFSKAVAICSSTAPEKFYLSTDIMSIDRYFRILSLTVRPLTKELPLPQIVWINNEKSNWSNEITLRGPSLAQRKKSLVSPKFQITFPESYVGKVVEFVISCEIEYPEYVERTNRFINKVKTFDQKYKVYVVKGKDEENLLNEYRSLDQIEFGKSIVFVLLGILLLIIGVLCWGIAIFIFLKMLSSFRLWKSFWVFIGCYLVLFICMLLLITLSLLVSGYDNIPSISNQTARILFWVWLFGVPGLISFKLTYNYHVKGAVFSKRKR